MIFEGGKWSIFTDLGHFQAKLTLTTEKIEERNIDLSFLGDRGCTLKI